LSAPTYALGGPTMHPDELPIRRRAVVGDSRGAIGLALARYGPEVYGFIRHVSRSEEDARDAYGIFCEDLCRGFGGFSWESSFRTWAYTLARHACFRQRHASTKDGAQLDLSAAAEAVEAPVRTETRPYLRTEVKNRFAALRAQLSDEERVLLTLRIDRELAWNDIARVMGETTDGDGDQGEEAVLVTASRLRKKFERTKERLRALAVAEGLLGEQA
jgi:RNA polymerase sigma-70 factor (ECF subfamily)